MGLWLDCGVASPASAPSRSPGARPAGRSRPGQRASASAGRAPPSIPIPSRKCQPRRPSRSALNVGRREGWSGQQGDCRRGEDVCCVPSHSNAGEMVFGSSRGVVHKRKFCFSHRAGCTTRPAASPREGTAEEARVCYASSGTLGNSRFSRCCPQLLPGSSYCDPAGSDMQCAPTSAEYGT